MNDAFVQSNVTGIGYYIRSRYLESSVLRTFDDFTVNNLSINCWFSTQYNTEKA
jgi:hypothetical protein